MKETWESMTTKEQLCARAEDLVAYLYGEADEPAARDFEAHAQSCAACRTELAEFRQVRVSIGAWRQQALGSLPAMTTNSSAVVAPVVAAPERKRSALAALREFFTLSPLWMRAATAVFVVAFCALVVLTVARYFEQPQTEMVKQDAPAQTPHEQVAEKKDEPKQQNVQAVESLPESSSPSSDVVTTNAQKKNRVRPKVNQSPRPKFNEQPQLVKTPRLQISPRESREIARDLRLTASNDEDDLPRLSDLIEEAN